MSATFRPPLLTLGLLGLLTLSGCQAAVQNRVLPIRNAGDAPSPVPAREQAAAPANQQLVRTGAEVCAAVANGWQTLRPQLTALRTAQLERRAPYRLTAVAGWRFFAGGWSHGDSPGRSLRLILDSPEGQLVSWDVSDPASYAAADQTTFPQNATRLRLDLDELLPGGGRLQVNQIFPLAAPGVGFQVAGRGDVAQGGLLGSLVIEALQATAPDGETLAQGELVLRARDAGATVQLAAAFDAGGMTGGRLMRVGEVVGRVLPGLPGQWVLATDEGTFGL
ncbi:MAG: hypothetical protein VKQ33_03255 [Candidatus Sericytochromatia bacterium]|nr:hypothetical protein [Candidatus Sericytochromatia bacterium]